MIAPPARTQWVLHPIGDGERARSLARDLGAPLDAARVLVNRGVDSAEAARRFLDPSSDDLHEPSRLLDLDRAVERIRRAVADGEGVLVHGDYDVDGVTSTYLLYAALGALGARVAYRIPHRTRDGYGLTRRSVEEARDRRCTLIVTVDCGVTAADAVAEAARLGIDTVITDHHEPPAELPKAVAVVDPHRPGCGYPFKPLAGVGVTFKLVQALMRGRGGEAWAENHLDVVAIGTIADVVPLVGENRTLARLGLERLNRCPRTGLRELIEVAGLRGKRISSGQVSFVIAPRINAAGRMGSAEQGLRLLLARDAGEARACAESLEEENERRRGYDEEALAEAAERVERELGWPDCASILLWSDRWHPGVIGIVASRLVERFRRPCILVALEGDRGRGSGRSLPGLDLNRLMEDCGDLVESHGGHAFAAGLTVGRDRLPQLRERFEALARERLTPEDFAPRLFIDAEVRIADCRPELVDWLERLSPHGIGNPEPVFMATGLRVESASAVGGGKHLRLTVRDGTGSAQAIGFGFGDRVAGLAVGATCDLAFVPERNEWNGETRIQLKLKGVRMA